MTTKEALIILEQATANIPATREEHQLITKSLQILNLMVHGANGKKEVNKELKLEN